MEGQNELASGPDSEFSPNGPRPLARDGDHLSRIGMAAVEGKSFDQAVDGRPLHVQALKFDLRRCRGGRKLRTHRVLIMRVPLLLVQCPR